MIDVPNVRSSHEIPTPCDGGLAIVLPFLVVMFSLGVFGFIQWNIVLALVGSGIFIALIGFIDDLRHIAVCWRLLSHFLGAFWVLTWLGGFPPLTVFSHVLELGWFGDLLAIVYLVWLLNLYNFMDGVDGIASIEAISVCLGIALLMWISIPDQVNWVIPLSLAAAVAGFFYWNFPPARIFMGDSGSCFLGITLGALSVQSAWAEPQLFWSWLILLGVFIVDATVTLVRRVLRGEKFYKAHRTHAYQNASRKFQSHLVVTLAVLTINVLWLFPISYLVTAKLIEGVIGILLAYFPLLLLALYYRAGYQK